MYESFYHLRTNPFSLAPDPQFCFRHTGHQQAREYLEYALKLGEGMVMVTGRPGTGKTTLVESFLDNLNTGSVIAARIAVSRLDSKDLLRAVAYAFDIEAEGHDKATLRHLIKQYLEAQFDLGRRALLIIDEAQGLPRSALDELRLLADLQAESHQMLQLFLVGQEQLHEQMLVPEMDYFQQRVIANYRLVPLDLQETRSYIEYRLKQAGWQGDPALTGAAVLDIYRFSRGVPRHINKLCNRLLLLGYGTGSHTLDREQVHAIIEEMGAEQLSPIRVEQSVRDVDADSLDEQALQQGLLSDLAIRMDEPIAPCEAVLVEPAIESGVEEPLEAVNLPEPVAMPQGSVFFWGRGMAAISQWQAMLAPSLVVVTVAVLTFAAITGIVNNDAGQRLAMLPGEPEQAHVAHRSSGQLAGLTVAAVADLADAVTAPDYVLLQRVLNDELPATAAGRLWSGATASTDVPSDSPFHEARNFMSQAREIDRLLVQGQQALADDRLLTPALKSAYFYFQGVLRQSPGNRDAASGIEQIVRRYVVLTSKALQQQDGMMANRYIARGLSIQPGNSELLALRERSSVPVIGQADGENDPSARRTVGQLLSRVKTFFIDASAVQPNTQASYQMTSSFLYE